MAAPTALPHRAPWAAGLALLIGAIGHAAAEETPASPWDDLAQVPSAELAQWRGGWTSADGVLVRFGFEQAVAVNGETLGHAQIDPVAVPLGDRAGAHQAARQLAESFRFTTTDGVQMHLGDQGMTLVLQNSLDGQLIQVLQDLDVQLEGIPVERLNRLGELMQVQMLEGLR
ncbi:hypothetical protein [Halorhodospira halophila]|uniref:Lipoprotein n=1 Tax=Halorhodospira halophila (strain DSM 244 / SL1) TaxID=349124 RepID=A1WV08_HALHL|nr:hypothetical protein [Halorhodospira halophila]ABM61520.1 hypothetical protein Hhal_0739 [Halorhodospira halophila SL1]MBK1728769.1 hypothetical protein [Halorhodospira halophila]